MKPELLERLICPACGSSHLEVETSRLCCPGCTSEYERVNGIPIFSPVPSGLIPFDPFERGPDLGTRWRQANWRFLQQNAASLREDAVILDVGAGRGDFAAIFKDYSYLALDLYPYPEVDLVADLTECVPFSPESLDAVILANVLEHVQKPTAFLSRLCSLLRPGGMIFATVPFLLKIHQAPFDFTRFTRYGLNELGESAGLEMASLEGYYDPLFLLTEARQNLERFGLKGQPRIKRGAGRLVLSGMRVLEGFIPGITGTGRSANPDQEPSPAPVGYHIIYHKPAGREGNAG